MAGMTRTEFLATLDKHGLSEETPDGFNTADQFGSYRQWVIPNTAIIIEYTPWERPYDIGNAGTPEYSMEAL